MSFTKAQLIGLINSNLANASNITAAELRQVLLDTLDATITGVNSDTQKVVRIGDYIINIEGDNINISKFHANTTDVNIQLIISDSDGYELTSFDPSGSVISRIQMDNDGKIFVTGIPTSDPSNTGQLYNDSGTLKLSL
jgi:hypothetical protein